MLELWIHAPPVDGAANDAVVDYVGDWLGVSRRDVSIVGGHTSRTKVVEIDGSVELPTAEQPRSSKG